MTEQKRGDESMYQDSQLIHPSKSSLKRNRRRINTKRRLAKRDGEMCRYCQGTKNLEQLTIEHLTPRCRGGGSGIYNLGLSCYLCNQKKGDMTDEEYTSFLLGEYEWCHLCHALPKRGEEPCHRCRGKIRSMKNNTPIFVSLLTEELTYIPEMVYRNWHLTSSDG